MEEGHRTIILVDNSTAVTGAAKALLAIAQRLQQPYKLVIITPSPQLYQDSSLSAKIIQMSFHDMSKDLSILIYPYHLIREARHIHSIVNEYERPVLHYNDCYNLTGILVKLFSRKTYLIYHFRLLPTSYLRSIYSILVRLIFSMADLIICNSRATCSALPDSPKKVHISDAIKFPEEIQRQKEGSPFRLLYVGNYIPGKGHDFALNCMAELHKLKADIRLRFVGGTMGRKENEAYKKGLISLSSQLGLDDHVEFGGFSNDLVSEYRIAGMLINFSVSESFSMVNLEAMAHGVPVVSLNSGGPAEFIIDGETGLLIEPGTSPAEVARKINALAGDQVKRDQITSNARKLVRQQYNLDMQIEKLAEVYEGS